MALTCQMLSMRTSTLSTRSIMSKRKASTGTWSSTRTRRNTRCSIKYIIQRTTRDKGQTCASSPSPSLRRRAGNPEDVGRNGKVVPQM